VSDPNPRLVVYYTLVATQAVSVIGSQISEYAVGIAVFRATGHATPLALVAFFSIAPAVLLGVGRRAARATGDHTYLAKAESLANALTVAQQRHGGRYPTRMVDEDLLYWLNSTVNTARAMDLLAEAEAAAPPAKERPFPVR